MANVFCPECGATIEIDESSYSILLNQVRDESFKAEVDERVNEKIDKALLEEQSKAKDAIAEKEQTITELQGRLNSFEAEKKLAISEVKNALSEEISELKAQIRINEKEYSANISALEQQKDSEIASIRLQASEDEKRLKREIDFYKELKIRQSTKMVGESLEQHCEIEFNKVRAAAFQTAYFEKDNDVVEGSKGDYIFKDYDETGNAYISIMFEMKNEMDETEKKHKNEDFLKKLDSDRKKKNCEYAVLVSMLEPDNEYYNQGIVDVSHRYPKMYVIRPQFFIPFITMLRNEAQNTLYYRHELDIARSQSIDVENFEERLLSFKDRFSKDYLSANKHFDSAIDEIDKAIKALEEVKKELTGAGKKLEAANKKAENLTIKSLCKGNPTMTALLLGESQI